MKVTKTVTTQYKVALPTDITPIILARAIRKLEDEGVKMEHSTIEMPYKDVFIVTTNVKTYYDDSTLHKMEPQ